jgi:hypothetical protein
MDFSKLSPDQMKVAEMVVDAANSHGVDPNLLLAQAFQESGFNHIPNKKTDAFGVMQIRPGTAKDNNLGDTTDLRNNVYGGAKLMKQYLDKYKSPEAALLAYHQGPGVADKYTKNNGDLSFVGPNGIDYVIKIGENGGFGQPVESQNVEDQKPSPFSEISALPSGIDEKAPEKRPNLSSMPDFYQKGSRLVRNREGDISGGTLGTAGAIIGAGTSLFGNKGLAEMEKGVKNAQTAYEAAKAAAQGAVGASADTAQKLAAEAQRLEQQYRTTLSASQALERELADAMFESKRYLPPEVNPRSKVAGESGTKTYARVMPGQVPPEAMLAEIEDQTRGKNIRGKGAWDIADKNAANIEKQNRLGMSDYKMSGTGSEQLVLSPEETARRQTQMSAAGKDVKRLTPLVEAAQTDVGTALDARKSAEALRQREVAAAQKAAREAQTAEQVAKTGIKAATQAAPSGVGKIGALWQKIPFANTLGGLGMGMSAAEALNRYEKGDTTGAVISTVQTLLDGMSMLPPGTPLTAALKGIGVTGGLALTAADLYRSHLMEKENSLKKARGGLALVQ